MDCASEAFALAEDNPLAEDRSSRWNAGIQGPATTYFITPPRAEYRLLPAGHVREVTGMPLRTRRQGVVCCRCVISGCRGRRRRAPSSPDRRGGAPLLAPQIPSCLSWGRPCRSCMAAGTRALLRHRAVDGEGRQVVAATAPCFLRLAGRRRHTRTCSCHCTRIVALPAGDLSQVSPAHHTPPYVATRP